MRNNKLFFRHVSVNGSVGVVVFGVVEQRQNHRSDDEAIRWSYPAQAEDVEEIVGRDGGGCWGQSCSVGQDAVELSGCEVAPELLHAHRLVALGESEPLGVAHQRHMSVARCTEAEDFIEIELLGGGEQEIAAADHVGYTHQGVVDHHGELIGSGAVGALHHEIAAMFREVDALRPENPVGKRDDSVRHIYAGGGRSIALNAGERGAGRRAACAGIHYPAVSLMRSLRGHDVGAPAMTRICQPC